MSVFFRPAAAVLCSAMFVLVETKVCKSSDVRNTPQHISDFRDCRVIEGHLQVVLMERVSDFTDFYHNSFAELYEITDYLILYRVMHLTSLDLIFPKLTTIGGKKLFLGNSLVLYDLPDLEEIGLVKLQNIGYGSVNISRCPKLCYVDTLNWTAINASHVAFDRDSTCKDELCPAECRGFCWNKFRCQSTHKTDCHPACVGCTQPNSPKHCVLCRYFNDTGTCVQNCSDSKLIDNEAGRCISPQECISKTITMFHNTRECTSPQKCVSKVGNWSIFNKTCVEKCPFWFVRDPQGNCIPSETNICPGIKITSNSDLEQMIGCTHIDGSLEISLNGDVENEDLEISLKLIVSISGYLKITRSPSITSLSFFQELKTIKGEKLWSRYYSLFVAQNPNLQKLFRENATLLVENGEAIFQENPYLCPSEIEKINVTSNYSNSNGKQTACNLTLLNVTIVENNSTNVTLSWDVDDNSTIMYYTVYYLKQNMHNTTLKLKDGCCLDKDLCLMEDDWSSILVLNNTVLLKRLIPYTFYWYYIRTTHYSKFQEETPIFYFKTATGDPTEPIDLEAQAQTDTTIVLRWRPPFYHNGNLTYYNLAVYIQEDCLQLINQRNYCFHPLKETNCSCPAKEEVQLLYFDGTCIGNGNHYCNTKTVYNTTKTSEDFRIQKRSLEDDCSYQILQEYLINDTSYRPSHVVTDLRPFTLYIFYLRACNHIEKGESEHCGGAEMISKKTKKRKGVDEVLNVTVEVDGQSTIVTWEKPVQPNSVIVAYHVEYKKLTFSPVVICRQSQEFESENFQTNISDLDEGKYAVRVRAVTLAGSGEASEWRYFQVGVEEVENNWIYVLLALFATIISLLLGLVIWRRYKLAKIMDTHNLLLKMRSERMEFEEEDAWALDDETVEIIRELGQNSIGILYRKND